MLDGTLATQEADRALTHIAGTHATITSVFSNVYVHVSGAFVGIVPLLLPPAGVCLCM